MKNKGAETANQEKYKCTSVNPLSYTSYIILTINLVTLITNKHCSKYSKGRQAIYRRIKSSLSKLLHFSLTFLPLSQ